MAKKSSVLKFCLTVDIVVSLDSGECYLRQELWDIAPATSEYESVPSLSPSHPTPSDTLIAHSEEIQTLI